MTAAIYFPGLVPTTFRSVADFVTTEPHAVRRFAGASEVLGYSLVDAYATAEVYDWEIYEAGFLALTLALADWTCDELGVRAGVCGGQSFGAIAAAVHVGALAYPEAIALVRRSTAVETSWFAAQPRPLGCLFFYRMSSADVDALVAELNADGRGLEVSIYLDNSVHAVSGPRADLEVLEGAVRERGGFPFYTMDRSEHCSAVAGLRERLAHEVYGPTRWEPPRTPFLSDVTGELLSSPTEIRDDLLDGWTTPVHWSTITDGMRRAEVDRVHIVGPRNMFARITNKAFPTTVVTPRTVADHAARGAAAS